jgi:7-keto-8-aminopelargonate synthetase-like enzyme
MLLFFMNQLSPALKLMTDSMSHAKSLGVIHGHFTDHHLNGQTVKVFGRDLHHFANCSYLGLELDPRIKEAAKDAIDRYGVQFSCSKTYLSSHLYEVLEDKLSQVFGKPTLVPATTSLGHISWIPNVIHKNDAVIMDQQVHRSVQNAVMIAKANGTHVELVRHNRMDLLEEKVVELSKTHQKIWYTADGVYSMFGDVAPVQELYDLMDKYEQFNIYVDDAHGMSWAGENGRGYFLGQVSYFHDKLCLITSLCKGFGTNGAVMVFANEAQKALIKYVGSTLIFSGPVPPASLAAGIASADIHLSEEINFRQQSLHEKMQFFVDKSNELNLPLVRQDLSPICFIGTGPNPNHSIDIAHDLQKDGFFVNASSFPIVPLKNAGLRITLTVNCQEETINNLLVAIKNRMDERGTNTEEVMKAFTYKALAEVL